MALRTMQPCVSPPRAALRAASTSSSFVGQQLVQQRLLATPRPARQVTRMGLFGLGVPEIAVIAGVVALIYGKPAFTNSISQDNLNGLEFEASSSLSLARSHAEQLSWHLFVAVLSAGPSKLPEVGKGLGKTFKSFQTAAKEFENELKAEIKDDAEQPPEAATKKDS
jgi:Sec-independent protein translocase protein TatA